MTSREAGLVEACERVVRSAMSLLDAACAEVWLEAGGGELELGARAGAEGPAREVAALTARSGALARAVVAAARPVTGTDALALMPGHGAATGVPVVVAGRAVGALVVASAGVAEFDLRPLELLGSLAEYLASALEAAPAAVPRTDDSEALLDRILGDARRALDAGMVALHLATDGRLAEVVRAGPAPDDQARVAALAERAREAGRPVTDFRRDASLVALPVLGPAGGGALVLQLARPPSDAELALLGHLAGHVALALGQASMYQAALGQARQASALVELARTLTETLDPALVSRRITDSACALLAAHAVALYRVDPDDGAFEALAHAGARPTNPAWWSRRPRGWGLLAHVLATGRAARTPDRLADPRAVYPAEERGEIERSPWRAILVVPLASRGQTVGMLTVADRTGREFSDRDMALAESFAAYGAVALRNAGLFAERERAFAELAAAQEHLLRTEKLRAVGELAAGVAHDFNNLLAVVLGRTELLLARPDCAPIRAALETIRRSALDGAQTVRRLQDLTRIRRDTPLGPIDVNGIAREALELTEMRWRGGPEDVEAVTQLGDVPAVLGEPAELREVLVNLVLNAIDAMPSGGRLTVSTVAVGGRVRILVADTGTGMSPAVRAHLFEPFFTTKGASGTGLGLAVSAGIVARHGGRIDVVSAPGQGTTFTIDLPAAARRPAAVPAAPADAARRTLRCLVVDDEPAVGTMLGELLETLGHRAIVVSSAPDALDRVAGADVVLTDLAMPEIDGWELAALIRARAPALPVVLVTGTAVDPAPAALAARGVAALLPKPVTVSALGALLDGLVVSAATSQAERVPAATDRQLGDLAGRQLGDLAGRQLGDPAGRQRGDPAGGQGGDPAGPPRPVPFPHPVSPPAP